VRHIFYINPAAGRRSCMDKLASRIDAYFAAHGGSCAIVQTAAPRELVELSRAEALKGGEVRMYACGGDGTMFDLVNGVYGLPNVEVGEIPCGSANDFIRFFGTPEDFMDIEGQVLGASAPLDVIREGERYALNQCSMGMDAEVAARKDSYKNLPLVSGSMSYNLALLSAFIRNTHNKFRVRFDGGDEEAGDYLFVVAANAPYYGGGFMSAPAACPNDGLLECVTIDSVPRRRILALMGAYRRGEHVNFDFCRIRRVTQVEIWAEKQAPVNMDGEIFRTNHAVFSVAEQRIRFIVPGICARKMNEKERAELAAAKRELAAGSVPAFDVRHPESGK